MADREEEIRNKNQEAAAAMQRAKQAQLENAKMQKELQAAARELARHQKLAMQAADRQPAEAVRQAARETAAEAAKTVSASALKQQEASREAAKQAMIYEAAKRRAEKKQAAKKAAELVARQKAEEAKIHHTSPETRELQNLLLQQIADIMKEETDLAGQAENPSDSAEEGFGDLVIMDSHGKELAPEPSAAIEKADKLEEPAEAGEKPNSEKEEKLERWGETGIWFQTFCWMHIPVFGFWYMFVAAVRKKTPREKRAFARAYVLYRMLVLLLAFTILYIFYRMGLSFAEQILAYIDAH